jgi:eukaryotic-like serine/threonine-protein kinase
LALAGDTMRSQTLTNDLAQHVPEDTSAKVSYLPVLRAQRALNRGNAGDAIALLQSAAPHELGYPRTAIHANFGALYPVYVRGEAYLTGHQGAQAAAEFQKILSHRGIVIRDPIGALARLQLGRSFVLAETKPGPEPPAKIS